MKHITLCMIVKDESNVIERCISSVSKYIDYYVICDTGSSDSTKDIIRNFFDNNNIRGEIHDDDWFDFGTNRTHALQKCYQKTEWALMIDADDYIVGNMNLSSLDSDADAYSFSIGNKDFIYQRTQLFNLKKQKWYYKNPLHEYPTCDTTPVIKKISGNYIWISGRDGNRSRKFKDVKEKYLHDYFTLKTHSTDNPRNQFYAAQSIFDAGLYDIAEKEYLSRITMKGWRDEVFYSWLKTGICRQNNHSSQESIIHAYTTAYQTDPNRVEPLYYLSKYLRENNQSASASLYAIAGQNIKPDDSKLFVHLDQYLWKIHDEIGSTAYYANKFIEGKKACEKLLSETHMPNEHKSRVRKNLEFYIT